MPVAKVTRLPPVRSLKPIDSVSTTTGRTCSTGMPSSSAAISASDAREPPMSGQPDITTAEPSSLIDTFADDDRPALNQKPQATPRPWFAPSGAR